MHLYIVVECLLWLKLGEVKQIVKRGEVDEEGELRYFNYRIQWIEMQLQREEILRLCAIINYFVEIRSAFNIVF